MKFLIEFIYLVCFCIYVTADSEKPVSDDELRKQLLTGYDKHTHPHQGNYPVNVSIGLALIQLQELDLWKEQLTVECWLRLVWNDPRLKYDGPTTVLRLPSEDVWRPDLEVYNSVNAGFNPIWRLTRVLVYPDGRVLWVPPGTTTTTCKTDITRYPHDQHTCDIKIGPWTQDISLINVDFYNDTYKVDVNDYWENNVWHLVETSAWLEHRTDPCCKEPFHVTRWSITMTRRSEYYRHVLVVPCLLTIILTTVIFLLPPPAGERIVLGSFTLLILIVILLYLGWKLPPSRDSVPKVVSFCGVTAIEVVMAIIVSVYAITKSRTHQISYPPPLAPKVLRGVAAKYLCLCHHKAPEEADSVPLEGSSEEQSTYQREWQDFLLVLDRILMIIYLFIMIVYALICFL